MTKTYSAFYGADILGKRTAARPGRRSYGQGVFTLSKVPVPNWALSWDVTANPTCKVGARARVSWPIRVQAAPSADR